MKKKKIRRWEHEQIMDDKVLIVENGFEFYEEFPPEDITDGTAAMSRYDIKAILADPVTRKKLLDETCEFFQEIGRTK